MPSRSALFTNRSPRGTCTFRCTLFLALLFCAVAAHAEPECKCGASVSTVTAYQLAQVVFSGTVVSTQPLDIQRGTEVLKGEVLSIRFDVNEVWKGKVTRKFSLTRAIKVLPECSFQFEVGREYLVFGDQSPEDVFRYLPAVAGVNFLDATKCGGTKLLAAASDELKYLGGGSAPQ